MFYGGEDSTYHSFYCYLLGNKDNYMLPAHIIDEIRKRELEDARRTTREQPRLELPRPPLYPQAKEDEDEDRGVVIVDL